MNTLYTSKQAKLESISSDLLTADYREYVHDISCQICLDIAFPTPISCGNCSRMFCRKCIGDWVKRSPKCPNDHTYKETQLNSLTKNLLHLIKLKCVNQCNKDIPYGEYISHIENDCDNIKFQCMGCSMVAQKSIILKHVKICESFNKKCFHCQQVFHIEVFENHSNNCSERKGMCTDCVESFKGSILDSHMET